MFCAPEPIFGGIVGAESNFHVLRSRTHFLRYRERRVQFQCFALPDKLSAVPRVSCPVFMYCAPRPIFSGIEGVESSFYVLRSQTRFWRDRGLRVMFSCFALSDLFSMVQMASGLVFRFYVPWTHYRRYRGQLVMFSYFALPDSF
jgi:hypothetical protein